MIAKISHTLELIKFSHSIFALPFALSAMIVAARGWPSSKIFLLIVAAMVTARSAAMAFNRLTDADIDAQNPRTQNRALTQGLLSKKFVGLFILICIFLFLTICRFINPLAFLLSPFVILFLLGYSLSKRFTWLTHLWLGLSLGLAPPAAWVAVTGQWPWPALWLAVAVAFWVGGFDIIYATQDFEFDRQSNIYSLVKRFGLGRSLWVSRIFHLFSVAALSLFGFQNHFGAVYFATVLLIAGALVYEQNLLRPNDLSRVNAAFFNMNGAVSLLFFAGLLLEILL